MIVKLAAGTPPKKTPVAPVKLNPVITTGLPAPVPQLLLVTSNESILGTVTHVMVAAQPGNNKETSERQINVNEPLAAVETIVPGEAVPEKAPAGQVTALFPTALPDDINDNAFPAVPSPLYIIKPS